MQAADHRQAMPSKWGLTSSSRAPPKEKGVDVLFESSDESYEGWRVDS
jgi:hypothetical protein